MTATKPNKWGNSQGVLVPKKLCEDVGFRVGDEVELTMNPRTCTIGLSCRVMEERR